MVLSVENDYMATGLARSRTLHNFAFPSWGMQRHMKTRSDGNGSSGGDSSDHQHQRGSPDLEFVSSSVVIPLHLGDTKSHQLRKSPSKSAENGSQKGIGEFREKIVRIKIAKSSFSKEFVEDDAKDQEERGEEVKRWSMRRRKPSSKVPIRLSNEDQSKELRTEERSATKKRERGVMAKAERKDPVKFSFQPSRNEIEEDFQRRKSSSKVPIGLNNKDQCKELKTEEKSMTKKIERCVMAEGERKYPVKFSFQPSRNEIEEDFQRRKSSSKVPIGLNNKDQCKELRTEERTMSRKRGRGVMAETKRKEPLKFSSELSRKEIEEDFIQIMGRRPHCRPKKRPRNVQKLIDNVFPGLYLTQVTPDLYKVLEVAERRRR